MRIILLLPLALLACATDATQLRGPAGTQPDTRGPAAILRLDRMKDQVLRTDWAGLAATNLDACAGPNDAVCAESQALRARGCRIRAEATPDIAARRPLLDCAVEGTRAALAASTATPPAEAAMWREALAWSLFERRQVQPRAAICADNTALREQADRVGSRFLSASARLTEVAEGCGAPDARCGTLAETRRLLTPAPPGDARWASMAAATTGESRRLGCR